MSVKECRVGLYIASVLLFPTVCTLHHRWDRLIDMAETETAAASVKTITYETRTSYESESSMTPVYKTMMTPRHLVINRTWCPGGLTASRSVERSSHFSNLGAPAGAYAMVTEIGVTAIKTSREREKKDMQDLNERFASYIEKVST